MSDSEMIFARFMGLGEWSARSEPFEATVAPVLKSAAASKTYVAAVADQVLNFIG